MTARALGRRTPVERRVLALLRGACGTDRPGRMQAMPAPAQARAFAALRRHAQTAGFVLLSPGSPYMSLDELRLLAWLAGAQRVVGPCLPLRGGAAFRAVIARCAGALDDMGLHLSPLTLYSARLQVPGEGGSAAPPGARPA